MPRPAHPAGEGSVTKLSGKSLKKYACPFGSGVECIFQYSRKSPALFAKLDFFRPVDVCAAAADGAVDKPAKAAGIEFPGRTVQLENLRTFQDVPAGLGAGRRVVSFQIKQKKHLPLGMGRDAAPSLFIAAHRFDGAAQQMRHFLLGFVQLFADTDKFF